MDQNPLGTAGGPGPSAAAGPTHPPGHGRPLSPAGPPAPDVHPDPDVHPGPDIPAGPDMHPGPDPHPGPDVHLGPDRRAARDVPAGPGSPVDPASLAGACLPLVSPATYWRRRAVALAAGVVVLTLIAWAVNGALGGSRASGQATARPGKTASSARGNGHARDEAASGLAGSRAGGAAGPGAHSQAGRGGQQALAGQAAELGYQRRANPRPSALSPGGSTAPFAGSQPPACARGAVVLSLHSPRSEYKPGKLPTFVVDAVSTGSRPCSFNLGTRFVSVVVASGHARIWNSATCVRRTGSRIVVLRRGVPAVFSVSWNRRTTPPGCRGSGSAVRAGTYTVVAFSDHLRSETMVFVLSGPGVAVP